MHPSDLDRWFKRDLPLNSMVDRALALRWEHHGKVPAGKSRVKSSPGCIVA